MENEDQMKRRKNGCGCLIRKGKGKPYLAKWTFQGKTFYQSTGKVIKAEANEVLQELLKPYQTNDKLEAIENLRAKINYLEQKRSDEVNSDNGLEFDDVFKYIDRLEIKNGTKNCWGGAFRLFISWLHEHHPKIQHWKFVTNDIAKDYMQYLSKRQINNTYNNCLGRYKKFYNDCKDKIHTDVNPFIDIKYKVQEETARVAFSVDDLNKIFKYILDRYGFDYFYVASMISAYCGMRPVDIVALKWSNFDFVNMEVRYIQSKVSNHNLREVYVPLHKELYDVLLKWKEISKDFDNKSLWRNDVVNFEEKFKENCSKKFHQVLKKLGYDTFTYQNGKRRNVRSWYSLRHTFGSLAQDYSGCNPMMVAKMLGHSSLRMLQRTYYHTDKKVMRNAIGTLPSFVSNNVVKQKDVKTDDKIKKLSSVLGDLSDDKIEKLMKLSSII